MCLTASLTQFRDRRRAGAVNRLEASFQSLNDVELRNASLALRYRARAGEEPRRLIVEAFALVREASRRTTGQRHYDVQLLGGFALCRRGLAEMQTGEGKTLTASLPLYVYALYGRGAHLATVNDYLARRDAELLRPVFAGLGLSVGVIESDTEPEERRRAYAADITYGTAKEFGFDYLRDRLQSRSQQDRGRNLIGRLSGEPDRRAGAALQREPFFMLVDEADSVLIDDAGTPLIISAAAGEVPVHTAKRYEFAAAIAGQFQLDEDYLLDLQTQRADLTAAGREKLRGLVNPAEIRGVPQVTLYEDAERAIVVDRLYTRDRNYVVREGEIAIVDEFTGRIAEGRKWRAGLHQAVEAKERLEITDDGGQAARITVQEFFLRYQNLAGMSGTAQGSARELKRIYKLRTAPIPTNRPPIRKRLSTRVYGTAEAKWRAVVQEVKSLHREGRPVLVGTRSIDKSERLSKLLLEAGLDHDVLNAHHEEEEAAIVARAGERGRITVATNMAGRGTDVRLGSGVREIGGLHVILTEMHDAARIDRQLVGRCGRQGDPGSFRYFLALDDDLLRGGLGVRRFEKLKKLGEQIVNRVPLAPPVSAEPALAKPVAHDGSLPTSYERLFHRAQRRVERRRFQQRKQLLAYERQRNQSAQPLGLDPHLDLPG